MSAKGSKQPRKTAKPRTKKAAAKTAKPRTKKAAAENPSEDFAAKVYPHSQNIYQS